MQIATSRSSFYIYGLLDGFDSRYLLYVEKPVSIREIQKSLYLRAFIYSNLIRDKSYLIGISTYLIIRIETEIETRRRPSLPYRRPCLSGRAGRLSA